MADKDGQADRHRSHSGQCREQRQPAQAQAGIGSRLQVNPNAVRDVFVQSFELRDDRLEAGTRQEIDIARGLVEIARERGFGDPVEVAFAVPPAIEFVIETVDATSGSAVAVPCIRWRQVRTDGVREARGAASRPSRCGAFPVRAPAGPLELSVGSRLYECEPVTLAPCAGDVVVLRVRGRRETAVR